MADQNYDYNAPYEPEKTVKGGAFVRNFVVIVLLAGMAGLGVMIASTPPSGQLGAGEQQVAENRLPAAYAPPVVAPPPGASAPEPAPVTRAAPRQAAPAAAELDFSPSAPPELPAPANPDMTIPPDIVEPLPPTEG